MNLLEMLERLPDFRRKQGQRYPLSVIMLITIMSIMSGRYRYREIAAFAEANKEELLKFFGLKRKRLASHVTFREI
ncbi:MAG: transposase family protein, partial [Desulfamplus sp.]|nr:transposase family protein [Desulfamplus sp.]